MFCLVRLQKMLTPTPPCMEGSGTNTRVKHVREATGSHDLFVPYLVKYLIILFLKHIQERNVTMDAFIAISVTVI